MPAVVVWGSGGVLVEDCGGDCEGRVRGVGEKPVRSEKC